MSTSVYVRVPVLHRSSALQDIIGKAADCTDPISIAVITFRFETNWLYCLKDADRMVNSAFTDQTSPFFVHTYPSSLSSLC